MSAVRRLGEIGSVIFSAIRLLALALVGLSRELALLVLALLRPWKEFALLFIAGLVMGALAATGWLRGLAAAQWSAFVANSGAIQGVAAVGAIFAGLVALLGLLYAARQVGIAGQTLEKQAEQLRLQASSYKEAAGRGARDSSRDCLWHFLSDLRRDAPLFEAAARKVKLVGNLPEWPDWLFRDADIQAVLDFYEGVGHMVRTGHLDDEAAWNHFFFAADDFWQAARKYVEKERHSHPGGDPTFWEEYELWLQATQPYNESRLEAARRRASS